MHFTEHFGIEGEVQFFDLNLNYDSPVFIDPFLIRKSHIKKERELFPRFGDYFRYAYDTSLKIDDNAQKKKLRSLLRFVEPKELSIGYTEASNKGVGPGVSFTEKLLNYFLNSAARHFIKHSGLYPDGKFNPVTVEIFTDGLGPDGISDLTANLIMDYLIDYTQSVCRNFDVPMAELPINCDGFDFDARQMFWKSGGYYRLPENPYRKGEAIILIPKHFLRAYDETVPNIVSKVKYILKRDPDLTERFADVVEKSVNEIPVKRIREVFEQETSVFKSYMEIIDEERGEPYDFVSDKFGILSEKNYFHFFDSRVPTTPDDAKEVFGHVKEVIIEFKREHELNDGWKDLWENRNGLKHPMKEVVLGRRFRAMGNAYFRHLRMINFGAEVPTGSGPADFMVTYQNTKIVIELKYLRNTTKKGTPPLSAYLHGLERQLPSYIKSSGAEYGVYITAQFYNKSTKSGSQEETRLAEVSSAIRRVEDSLRKDMVGFKDVAHYNVDLTPKTSASNV